MDNVLAVVPFDDSSKKKFESLFFAAFEQQKVAICRYVRSDNSKPKLGMLVYMSKGYSYFIKLPYEQDFRTKLTPDLGYLRQETVEVVKLEDEPIYKSKKRKHPLDFRTTTLDDANLKIDEFIDSLDLTQQDNFAMPKTIYHPTYQRLTAAISGRALNPDDKIPENVGTGFEVEERPLAESVAHCFKLLQTTTDEDADKNSGDRNLEETTQEMAEETQQVKEEDLINFDSKPPGDAFDIFFD